MNYYTALMLIALAAGACKSEDSASANTQASQPTKVAMPASPALVPLAENTRAPELSGTDQKGQQVSLEGLHGTPVVLYFYPADFGVNCSAEAVAFAEAAEQYKALGATIIGVSRNDMASHREFATKKNLPFSLLSDPDGALAARFGVGIMPNGKLWRVTFVIDRDGMIRKVFSGEPFVKNVEGHAASVLAALKTL